MNHISDLLEEYKEVQSPDEKLPVLTLTEKNGFVYQADRFSKRLATENTDKYKVITRDAFAFNPYLLWAGAIAHNDLVDRGIISPLYPTFKVRTGVDPTYVKYLLLSPAMIAKYDTIAFGSVPRRRRSSVKDFLNLQIPALPPLEEQKRIALTEELQVKIAQKREHQQALFEELRKAVFNDLFGNYNENLVKLGDIADISSGITKGRKLKEATREVPYLAVANVQAGHLKLESIKSIEATEAEIKKYKLEPGDIVLTEGGDPDKLGRGTIWKGELEEAIHQNHIFRVRLHDNSGLTPEFVAAYLEDSRARKYFLRSAKQTTGIASISKTQLSALPIPIPTQEVLNELSNFLSKLKIY